MGAPQPSRQQLEDLWRSKVERALADYRQSKEQYSAVLANLMATPPPSPDGLQTLRKAHQAEASALEEYLQAVRTFNKLVLDGVLPE
jgi:hypothetical protein